MLTTMMNLDFKKQQVTKEKCQSDKHTTLTNEMEFLFLERL